MLARRLGRNLHSHRRNRVIKYSRHRVSWLGHTQSAKIVPVRTVKMNVNGYRGFPCQDFWKSSCRKIFINFSGSGNLILYITLYVYTFICPIFRSEQKLYREISPRNSWNYILLLRGEKMVFRKTGVGRNIPSYETCPYYIPSYETCPSPSKSAMRIIS